MTDTAKEASNPWDGERIDQLGKGNRVYGNAPRAEKDEVPVRNERKNQDGFMSGL